MFSKFIVVIILMYCKINWGWGSGDENVIYLDLVIFSFMVIDFFFIVYIDNNIEFSIEVRLLLG